MLIPAGATIALALVLRRLHLGFRNAAGYGLIASTVGFVFVSVGGAGLIANLIFSAGPDPSCSIRVGGNGGSRGEASRQR